MFIDHDTAAKVLRIECNNCYRQWLFNESEIIFEPLLHVVCPKCGKYIPLY